MKCIIVSTSSEIVYTWCDEDYQEYLQQSTAECFVHDESFDLTSCLQILFSSLIASYDVLKSQIEETFSFVECKNDFLVCFHKYDQFLYIGLTQANVDQKDKVFRELGFVRKSIGVLFGPWGQHKLQTRQNVHKKAIWKCIDTLIESYMMLSKSESSFLLEGIEEIKFSDDILSPYKKLIQQCVDSYIRPNPSLYQKLQYIFLFVGSKVLCCEKFSPKPISLSTSSVLEIIAILHSDLRTVKPIMNNQKTKTSISESRDRHVSTSTAEKEEHFDDHIIYPKSDVDCLFDNTERMSLASSMVTTATQSVFDDDVSVAESCGVFSDSESKVKLASTRTRDLSVGNDTVSSEVQDENVSLEQYCTLPLFLTSNNHPFVPCQLNCFLLSPSVNMVIVCKSNDAVISDPICAMLFWLRVLNSMIDEEDVHVDTTKLEEKMKRSVKSLNERSKRSTKQEVKGIVRHVNKTWRDGKQNVKSFLQNKNLDNVKAVTILVKDVETKLHLLHKLLYPCCIAVCDKVIPKATLNLIHTFVKDNLSCYMDFLHVKSQQNVPIYLYMKKFPGLVYFAFVKRVTRSKSVAKYHDMLFVPSLSSVTISSRIGHIFLSALHKEIFCFINRVNSCLVDNKTKLVHKQKGLQFASTVVSTGRDLDLNLDTTASSGNTTQIASYASPSMLSSDYYDKCFGATNSLTSEDSFSYIYQLITVHYDCVPVATVFKQRQQLFSISSMELNSHGLDV